MPGPAWRALAAPSLQHRRPFRSVPFRSTLLLFQTPGGLQLPARPCGRRSALHRLRPSHALTSASGGPAVPCTQCTRVSQRVGTWSRARGRLGFQHGVGLLRVGRGLVGVGAVCKPCQGLESLLGRACSADWDWSRLEQAGVGLLFEPVGQQAIWFGRRTRTAAIREAVCCRRTMRGVGRHTVHDTDPAPPRGPVDFALA